MSLLVEQSIRPSILLLIVISTFAYEKLIRNMLQTLYIDSYEKFHYFHYIKNRWSRISPRLGNEMLSLCRDNENQNSTHGSRYTLLWSYFYLESYYRLVFE
jgi:hypothetical protein